MNYYWSALAAAAVSLLSGAIVRRYALKHGHTSDPAQLRYYSDRRPLFGFVPVVVGFWIGMALMFAGSAPARDDPFFGDPDRIALTIFWATFFLVLAAAAADRRHDRGYYDWLYVVGAALFFSVNGFAAPSISIPFVGLLELSPVMQVVVSVLWILVVVSVVETLEGIAGFLTLVPVVLACAYFVIDEIPGEIVGPGFGCIFGGSLLGFWPNHAVRDGLVLGKSGNKVVGFVFGVLTLISRRKMATWAFIVIPLTAMMLYIVLNSVRSLERRIRAG